MHPFGGPVVFYDGDAEDGLSTTTAHEDMDLVRRTLLGLGGGGDGMLRIYRPVPTAAFSPRDTTMQSYAVAAEAMRKRGFEPVERRAGGQLAIYDRNALVIDLVAAHPEPRVQFRDRFQGFAGAIAASLASLSVDARVGCLPGEYCPGDFSVNGAGRIKLVGVAQRIGRRGYHLGAVISVSPSEPAMAAVAEAYQILGMLFDPATFGAIADLVPDLDFAALRESMHAPINGLVAGE